MKKRFFASHAKSSAALISLAIHAVLIVIAVSFVAVTVIKKEEQNFQTKEVKRPRIKLKRLQAPINMEKKRKPKPKLRKRLVVKPRLNQKIPDIKMPEITGVKGGIGSGAGDGLGGGGGVGFTMPEIKIFGIKGKGEKIVLILDSTTEMMADKMGGIPAYTVIKNEMMRIVDELPPTALFNVLVYDHRQTAMAFPALVAASDANAAKLREWITPLNSVSKGMGDRDWGLHTLGPGGVVESDLMRIGKFENTKLVKGIGRADLRVWYRSVMLAHKMQADTIFVLTYSWNLQRVAVSGSTMSREEWDRTSAGRKWKEEYRKALAAVDEENRRRRTAGQAPKAIDRNEWALRREYYPTIQPPPTPGFYNYTPKDFYEGFQLMRAKYKSKTAALKSGVRKRKSKGGYSLNIIHFVPQDGDANAYNSLENFKQLSKLCDGKYKAIKGLKEIKSYVTEEPSAR